MFITWLYKFSFSFSCLNGKWLHNHFDLSRIKATGGGGGSEVDFEILRYVVELDLNFQMLLSLPKTKFPIWRYRAFNFEVYL